MTYRVVVTDHTFDALDVERKVLDRIDGKVELIDGSDHGGDVRDLVPNADAVIVMYEEITAEVLDVMENCRIVSRMGIGLDNVDIDAATEHGVRVTNVPDYCIEEVSTHTISLLLALKRNVVFYNHQTHHKGWDVTAGPEMHRLGEQTLGLVAFGRTAQEVGRKAAALDMEVLAWDPYLDAEEITEGGATPTEDLNDLLAQADAVSVHTPLTDETEGMVGAEEFKLLNNNAVVLNVARGGIIDEEALVTALDDGQIAGAGIDVLTEEPPSSSHPLVDRDDVILTPHAAWNSVESMIELRRKAAENVTAVLRGEEPAYLANKDVTD